MPGTQKYWINGQPVISLSGDGAQKYWIDGQPSLGVSGGVAPPTQEVWANLLSPNPTGPPRVNPRRISQFSSFPAFFGPETILINWDQPLSEPQQPPRIHVSVIPYDMFRPVYFAPETVNPPVFQPPNHPPPSGPAGRQNVRAASPLAHKPGLQPWLSDYQFYAGGYVGEELTTMDKWYQPIDTPGRPKKIITADIPSHWLVQFESPTFPIPTAGTWYVEWDNPLPNQVIHPSDFPFVSYVYLPPVSGCIDAEVTQYYIYRANPRPQMPILYIRNWNRYNTSVGCGNTQQSPSSQPEYSTG